MSRYPELTIQHIEQYRRSPCLLASGQTRDGKTKRFEITPDGWAYISVDRTVVATFTELQSAITDYNER
jgi:hypothetical protein